MKLNLIYQIKYIHSNEAPASLCSCIVDRIIAYERQVARRYAAFQGLVTLFSLVATVYVADAVATSFSQSGFYYYLELMFSGDMKVMTYWKEIGMSLAESLPVLGIAGLLTGIALILWSGSRTANNVRVSLSPRVTA